MSFQTCVDLNLKRFLWRKLVTKQFWWLLISIALTIDFHCVPCGIKTRGNEDNIFFFQQTIPLKLNFCTLDNYIFDAFTEVLWYIVGAWQTWYIYCKLQLNNPGLKQTYSLGGIMPWPWNNLWVIITSLDSSDFPILNFIMEQTAGFHTNITWIRASLMRSRKLELLFLHFCFLKEDMR